MCSRGKESSGRTFLSRDQAEPTKNERNERGLTFNSLSFSLSLSYSPPTMSLKIHLTRQSDGTWIQYTDVPPPTQPKSLKRRRVVFTEDDYEEEGKKADTIKEGDTILTSSLGDWTAPSRPIPEILKDWKMAFDDTSSLPLVGKTKAKSKRNEYPTEAQRNYHYRSMNKGERRMIDEKRFVYGQRVTSKHKALTMLDGERVMKGPIDPKKPMLALIYYRCLKLKEWGDDASVWWEIVQHPVTKALYLSTPNLGLLPERVVYKTVYHFDLPSGEVHIRGWCLPRITETVERDRGGVSRAIDELRCRGTLPSEMWRDLFYHLLLRWVIKGGDTGLWNVINGYGIDFEEERGDPKEGQTPTTLYSLLMETKRKPKKEHEPEIRAEVEKWRSFLKEKWHANFTSSTVFSTTGEKARAALAETLLEH